MPLNFHQQFFFFKDAINVYWTYFYVNISSAIVDSILFNLKWKKLSQIKMFLESKNKSSIESQQWIVKDAIEIYFIVHIV
mgnify:CR=1 FL=1